MTTTQTPAAANGTRLQDNGLGRPAGKCYDHRLRVLAGWLLAAVAIIGLAQWAGSRLDNNFSLGSSPSQRAQNLLASRLPSPKSGSAEVVLRSPSPLDSPANVAAIGRLARSLRPLAHVAGVERWARIWARTGDNSSAVANGLAATPRVITAAAAIMVCAFGSFVIGGPLRLLAVFGLGLAVAVLIDATVVRVLLVPAVMQLLGSARWWLPGLIGRAIPGLTIEPNVDHRAGGGLIGPQPVSAAAAA
jgi:uncharacterized membrane protein YdfJ with MMPL/SSD domain